MAKKVILTAPQVLARLRSMIVKLLAQQTKIMADNGTVSQESKENLAALQYVVAYLEQPVLPLETRVVEPVSKQPAIASQGPFSTTN